jgi:hypothetical protein
MKRDYIEYIKKFHKCQVYGDKINAPLMDIALYQLTRVLNKFSAIIMNTKCMIVFVTVFAFNGRALH